jgi:hypothetical protein
VPTNQPSSSPLRMPTSQPSYAPTNYPSSQPSRQPSYFPTNQPFQQPSIAICAWQVLIILMLITPPSYLQGK